MKNPPTLADALVAYSTKSGLHPVVAKYCRAMLTARKFVLDEAMSRYWADLEMTLTTMGSLKKQLRVLDMVRRQARLPHALTWIEHDPRPYRDQTMQHGLTLKPGSLTAARRGFLLQQHPTIETAFRCAHYTSYRDIDDFRGNNFGFAWCSDDATPIPWRAHEPAMPGWRTGGRAREIYNVASTPADLHRVPPPPEYEWSDAEILAGLVGFRTSQVCLTQAASAEFEQLTRDRLTDLDVVKEVWALRAEARAIWMLLATINDLPVEVEHVIPSKGYVARGSYKKFLEHRIIHLTVPQKQWRTLTTRVLVAMRRKAHQVRGFWRRDWRRPLTLSCLHEFDDDMVCQRCGGHKIFVHEHQRGDASLGFVTHDYDVTHPKEPPHV